MENVPRGNTVQKGLCKFIPKAKIVNPRTGVPSPDTSSDLKSRPAQR